MGEAIPLEWTLASIDEADEAKEELDLTRSISFEGRQVSRRPSTDHERPETVLRMGSRVKSTRLAALTRAMSSRGSMVSKSKHVKPLKVKPFKIKTSQEAFSLTGARSRRRLSLVDAPADGSLEETPDDDPIQNPSFQRSVSTEVSSMTHNT